MAGRHERRGGNSHEDRTASAAPLLAWSPYLFLVLFVLIWGYPPSKPRS